MPQFWDNVQHELPPHQAYAEQLRQQEIEQQRAKEEEQRALERQEVLKRKQEAEEKALRKRALALVAQLLQEVLENSQEITSAPYSELSRLDASVRLQWGSKGKLTGGESAILRKYQYRTLGWLFTLPLGLLLAYIFADLFGFPKSGFLALPPLLLPLLLLSHGIHGAWRAYSMPEKIIECDYKYIEVGVRGLMVEDIPLAGFLANPESLASTVAKKLAHPLSSCGHTFRKGWDFWMTPVSSDEGFGN